MLTGSSGKWCLVCCHSEPLQTSKTASAKLLCTLQLVSAAKEQSSRCWVREQIQPSLTTQVCFEKPPARRISRISAKIPSAKYNPLVPSLPLAHLRMTIGEESDLESCFKKILGSQNAILHRFRCSLLGRTRQIQRSCQIAATAQKPHQQRIGFVSVVDDGSAGPQCKTAVKEEGKGKKEMNISGHFPL